MTLSPLMQRRLRPVRRDPVTHAFAIGQAVRLKGGLGILPRISDVFYVTATLPPRGNSLQYRVRNDEERHERVATEDSLEFIETPRPSDEASLIERTFGHGQGAETQQSRDQEAEAGKGAAET